MNPVSTEALLGALRWRYATQKFDPERRIPEETWSALEEALVLTPSTFGLQPWKFVVVRDPELRQRLSAASWGQKQPLECSHFVVFALRKGLDAAAVDRFIGRSAEVRGIAPDQLQRLRNVIVGATDRARAGGYLDSWMSCQVYIALGQFMAAAALLGVDTCPMEGLKPEAYDEILGLAAGGYGTLCACAAGYRAADDKYAAIPKVRFPVAEVVARR
ncbi:MAG TPA: NAD(P)H-dependent oxidoreductase [Opitutaceae bacterium]|nr:NAD(P)H-dependent oxidoreductase [Opitutaceae bacterium]